MTPLQARTRPGPPDAGRRKPRADRLARYASLTRLDKPIGILLLLWPTLDALWILSLIHI